MSTDDETRNPDRLYAFRFTSVTGAQELIAREDETSLGEAHGRLAVLASEIGPVEAYVRVDAAVAAQFGAFKQGQGEAIEALRASFAESEALRAELAALRQKHETLRTQWNNTAMRAGMLVGALCRIGNGYGDPVQVAKEAAASYVAAYEKEQGVPTKGDISR